MTVSNTTTSQEYQGDTVTTVFAIPFDFQPNTISQVADVFIVDGDGDIIPLVEGTDFEFVPAGPNPISVDLSEGTDAYGAPSAEEVLVIRRITPLIQEKDLDAGGPATPYNPTTIENALDKLTRIAQELEAAITEVSQGVSSVTVVSGVLVLDWAPATAYLENQVVIFNLRQYRALSAHTSTGSFAEDLVNNFWELIITQGQVGPPGPKGLQGEPGVGIQGPPGQDGADGADGIFSDIANQAEAEAGTDNVKGMTPLRVSQAIGAQVPGLPVVQTLQSNVTTLQNSVTQLNSAVASLQSFSEFARGRFAGSQRLENDQSVPLALLGRFAPNQNGKNDPLNRDGDGTEFAKVHIFVRRVNDEGDIRFTSFDLVMHYIDSVWYIARDGTRVLSESVDLDGVVLSVVTDGDTKMGQVHYVTDDMGGSGDPGQDEFHRLNSEIKWWGQEIPFGV